MGVQQDKHCDFWQLERRLKFNAKSPVKYIGWFELRHLWILTHTVKLSWLIQPNWRKSLGGGGVAYGVAFGEKKVAWRLNDLLTPWEGVTYRLNLSSLAGQQWWRSLAINSALLEFITMKLRRTFKASENNLTKPSFVTWVCLKYGHDHYHFLLHKTMLCPIDRSMVLFILSRRHL